MKARSVRAPAGAVDGSVLARWLRIVVCVGVWVPATAHAHGADANTADIRLAGTTAYVVVWPTSDVFLQFDDSGDGLIQKTETRAHRDAMLAHFRQHFVLEDQAGRRGATVFEDLSTSIPVGAGPDAGADHLRVTLRIRWPEPPAWLVLRYTLFGEVPLRVRSARVTAAKALHKQRLLAPPELTLFDRAHPRHALLKSSAPTTQP